MLIIAEPGLALTYPQATTGNVSDQCGNYVISLSTLQAHWFQIERSLQAGSRVGVEKADESCATIWHTVNQPVYRPWFDRKQLFFITGGAANVPNLNSEHMLTMTVNTNNNQIPILTYTNDRPYTFLFTNRKIRPHRRYLITELKRLELLDRALWCARENTTTWGHPEFNVEYCRQGFETQQLPQGYDPEQEPEWIDGYVYPRQYQDTWFSLVAETVFEYPWSFRTEKIYKPILAGHPFIAAANYGFYRDLRDIGFMSYNNIIDESFDLIVDNQKRLDRIVHEVRWLCSQNLVKFWQELTETRLYNQQHLLELHNNKQKKFDQDFLKFIYA